MYKVFEIKCNAIKPVKKPKTGMPKRQMLSICQKEGHSVAELTDIQNELRCFHGEAVETAGTCLSLRGHIRPYMVRISVTMQQRCERHRLSLQKVFWRDKFYDKITHR